MSAAGANMLHTFMAVVVLSCIVYSATFKAFSTTQPIAAARAIIFALKLKRKKKTFTHMTLAILYERQ